MALNFTAIDFETANSSSASACSVGLVKVHDGVVVDRVAWFIRPPAGFDQFTERNVYVRHWARLDREGAKKAIELLVEHDWLRVERIETGGRPSYLCHVNPRSRS